MSSCAYCSTFVARVRRKEHMRFHGVPGGTAVRGQRARCGGERVSGFDLPKSSQRLGTSAILVAGARARQAGCIAGMTRSASIEMPRASRSAKRAPESINRQRADALWRCMKPALRPAGGGASHSDRTSTIAGCAPPRYFTKVSGLPLPLEGRGSNWPWRRACVVHSRVHARRASRVASWAGYITHSPWVEQTVTAPCDSSVVL